MPNPSARLVAVTIAIACVAAPARAQLSRPRQPAADVAPKVLKVEPPNWWVGHTINPVRVLIRGSALGGARLESDDPSLSIGLTSVNAGGTYVMADVHIAPNAAPGNRRLRIVTTSGRVEAPFEISQPLARAGRFAGFGPDDVLYLLMPDRFTDGNPANDDPAISRGLFDRSKPRYYHGGDLAGVMQRLPYLKDLGVTTLWLNPWYDNVNHLNEREKYDNQPIADYHGYGAVDFYGVEEHFGTMDELRRLVDAAHAVGLKVIQDQVANHTGPYHPWATDPPTPTWYNGTVENHLANTWQTWTLQAPNAAPAMQKATLDGWFIDILPDLNQNDDEAARYIIQNSLWWVGMLGLDGIRQDTWPYVPRAFWQRWMVTLKREYPTITAVGELFDSDPAMVSFFSGGAARFDGVDTKVDSLFDFPLLGTMRQAFAQGRPVRDVAQMLARDHLYPDPSRLVTFIGNHDMPRFMSEPGATSAGLQLAQTFLLTVRGIPQLFYGDEIGMTGGGDPDNRRSIPGAFPGDARDAFTERGRTADEQQTFAHVKTLLALRRELEPLRRGSLLQLQASEQQFTYARRTPAQAVIIAINNDASPATWAVDLTALAIGDGATWEDRLGNAGTLTTRSQAISITLPARRAAILVRVPGDSPR